MTTTKYQLPDNVRTRIGAMLTLLAREVRPCKRCGRTVYMVPTAKSGSMAPFTDDAVSHFADCPEAEHFKSKTP